MQPECSLEIDNRLIVNKIVAHRYSNFPKNKLGQVVTIRDLIWEGRNHNRYVSTIYVRTRDGGDYNVVPEQLCCISPNYEPDGKIITCTACGRIMYENELHIRHGQRCCPTCNTIDPENS